MDVLLNANIDLNYIQIQNNNMEIYNTNKYEIKNKLTMASMNIKSSCLIIKDLINPRMTNDQIFETLKEVKRIIEISEMSDKFVSTL